MFKNFTNSLRSSVSGRGFSDKLKVAAVCQGFGVIFYLVGFATPYWRIYWFYPVGDDRNHEMWGWSGLFTECRGQYDKETDIRCQYDIAGVFSDLMKSMAAYSSLSFIFYVLSCAVLPLYNFVQQCRNRHFLMGGTVLIFGGVAFALLAWSAFKAQMNKDADYKEWWDKKSTAGWSFMLAMTGTALVAGAGAMVLYDLVDNQS